MHNRFAVLAEDLTDDDTDNTDDTIIHLLSAPKQARSTHCSKSRVKTHTNTRVRSKKSKKGQGMVSKPTPTPTVEETPTLDVLQQLQFAVHTHTMDPAVPLRARKRPEDPQDKAVSKCSDLLSCLGVVFMVGGTRVNEYGRRQRQRRAQTRRAHKKTANNSTKTPSMGVVAPYSAPSDQCVSLSDHSSDHPTPRSTLYINRKDPSPCKVTGGIPPLLKPVPSQHPATDDDKGWGLCLCCSRDKSLFQQGAWHSRQSYRRDKSLCEVKYTTKALDYRPLRYGQTQDDPSLMSQHWTSCPLSEHPSDPVDTVDSPRNAYRQRHPCTTRDWDYLDVVARGSLARFCLPPRSIPGDGPQRGMLGCSFRGGSPHQVWQTRTSLTPGDACLHVYSAPPGPSTLSNNGLGCVKHGPGVCAAEAGISQCTQSCQPFMRTTGSCQILTNSTCHAASWSVVSLLDTPDGSIDGNQTALSLSMMKCAGRYPGFPPVGMGLHTSHLSSSMVTVERAMMQCLQVWVSTASVSVGGSTFMDSCCKPSNSFTSHGYQHELGEPLTTRQIFMDFTRFMEHDMTYQVAPAVDLLDTPDCLLNTGHTSQSAVYTLHSAFSMCPQLERDVRSQRNMPQWMQWTLRPRCSLTGCKAL